MAVSFGTDHQKIHKTGDSWTCLNCYKQYVSKKNALRHLKLCRGTSHTHNVELESLPVPEKISKINDQSPRPRPTDVGTRSLSLSRSPNLLNKQVYVIDEVDQPNINDLPVGFENSDEDMDCRSCPELCHMSVTNGGIDRAELVETVYNDTGSRKRSAAVELTLDEDSDSGDYSSSDEESSDSSGSETDCSSDSENGNSMSDLIFDLSKCKLESREENTVLTEEEHLMGILAFALKHSCSLEQIKDLMELIKIHCPKPNSCEISIDTVKAALSSDVQLSCKEYCHECY